MMIHGLGAEIRRARQARRLTQAQLAASSGLSRNTLNRLENGLFPDLGIRKAEAILERLGLELAIRPAGRKRKAPDYVAMACATASASFREVLTPEELVHALLCGRVPANREAHFIVLLEEGPVVLLKGLVKQVGAWVKPGKVARNVARIAKQVGLTEAAGAWRRIGSESESWPRGSRSSREKGAQSSGRAIKRFRGMGAKRVAIMQQPASRRRISRS